MKPRIIGRYEVIGELGQGAMGMVYKAKDPLIEREVAIKTINLDIGHEEREEYEKRFYQEAKAAGKLNHPNIVTIYDVGKSDDVAYMAMEFLEGQELRSIMNQGRLSVLQTLDTVIQVAEGLAYAHQYGVIHRDIKPSNIMVTQDGYIKITDFGIARIASSSVHTQVGVVLGSPKYMSPEQVLGKDLDTRSDIFSLGVTLYEMLTGVAPFIGESVNTVMYQTVHTTPTPPSQLNNEVTPLLDAIVNKALAKKVEERHQRAKTLVEDLKKCRNKLLNIPDTPATSLPQQKSGQSANTQSETEKTAKLAALVADEDALDKTQRLNNTLSNPKVSDQKTDRTLKISTSQPLTSPKPIETKKPITPEVQKTEGPSRNKLLLIAILTLIALSILGFLLSK